MMVPVIFQISLEARESKLKMIYVDDDGSADFTCIQDAIDYADDGDTVFVYSGTYYGNIVLDKSLNVIGEDKYSTIIDGMNAGRAVLITAPNGVVIKNFTINNGKGGISIGEWNASSKNNIIQNNIILVKSIGINVYSSENDIISNNTIMNCDVDGMRVWHYSQNIKIIGNTIFNCGRDGLWIDAQNIEISGNEIYNNGRNGMMLGYWYVDNVRVSYNRIYSNGCHGIFILGSGWPGLCCYAVEKNIVSNNNYCGIWVSGPALFIKIKNNHFEGNGASGVEFEYTYISSVKQNNFINNGRNAWFASSFFNVWSNNYWDDWIGIGPKLIEGIGQSNNYRINLDWFPAKEPYII